MTGDASRYFPVGTFAAGVDGKDQVAIESAVTTLLVAIILASCAWGAAKAACRCEPGKVEVSEDQ